MTLSNPAVVPARPLNGTKVIEFCQVAAGPFCGMLLADFGAEVIKVEPPEGDAMRHWPPITQGFSENFASLNRGKRSIALDLKNPHHLETARRLALEADVLVENNRPGAMARLGLGWEWFQSRKPQLVYCSISAFGQSGPRSSQGGYDLTIQAASGVMSVTGESDGAPVKAGVPVADFTSGLYAAFSIAAMLHRARRSGTGGHIDVPMFAATLAISALQTSEFFGTGSNPAKMGSAHPRNAPYQAYEARDGWFVIAAGNNRLWQSVCVVTEQLHLAQDERFKTPALRARHQVELKALLDPSFCSKPVDFWLESFAAAGVPCSSINGYREALEDPQADHLELVREQVLPGGKSTRTVGCPIRIDGRSLDVDTCPPALDQDGPALRSK